VSAREQILAGIRRARGRAALDSDAAAGLEARLAGHARGPIPARSAGLDARALVELFERQAQSVSCSVDRVSSLAEIPEALSRYLAGQNLPPEVEMAPDPLLDRVPWSSRPMLRVARGTPSGKEGVGVAAAFAGVAETGTLVLASGPNSPASLNFLPDTHVVVLPVSRMVGPLEDAWARLRAAGAGPGAAMPRTVNFITGPSRTADVEQKIEMGAHGPRRLHVILVADPAVG
jgi:L-lactate dehydrogenase complex protein LldG